MYDASAFTHVEDIVLSDETKALLEKANAIYEQNFNGEVWYGRCIFISWYCSLADCTFCYRSTDKHQKSHPETSKRSMGSILLEALFCRVFNWRIEFLTGGYGIMPFDQLLEIMKAVSMVYGEKIWLNLGVLPQAQLEQCKPYIAGICGSMETLEPELHDKVCPRKPIKPYDQMFSKMTDFKKSIAVIVGLGDTRDDMHYLFDFIEKHAMDRITLYALKPIKGTPHTEAPSVEEYVYWLAAIRVRFPKLEIIAGTNLRRSEEVGYVIKAGVNAVTKFPATKQFATKKAQLFTELIENENRTFISNITKYPDIDWIAKIDSLAISDEYKEQMKLRLGDYIHKFQNPKDVDSAYRKDSCSM